MVPEDSTRPPTKPPLLTTVPLTVGPEELLTLGVWTETPTKPPRLATGPAMPPPPPPHSRNRLPPLFTTVPLATAAFPITFIEPPLFTTVLTTLP